MHDFFIFLSTLLIHMYGIYIKMSCHDTLSFKKTEQEGGGCECALYTLSWPTYRDL
jgi:hypothetical protein